MLKIFSKSKLPKNSPEFMIIGPQKAGTTTLFDMLNKLDIFSGSINKEVRFFSNNQYYDKGRDFYHKFFIDNNKVSFEATPAYLYYDFVPQRIYKYNKKMKFIVLLREPSERCCSAWSMFRRFNKNNPQNIYDTFIQYANPDIKNSLKEIFFSEQFPSFTEMVRKELNDLEGKCLEPSFVRRGIYAKQISNFLNYFDLRNILFLEQRELYNQNKVINLILNFLEIQSKDIPEFCEVMISNKGDYPELNEMDKKTLLSLKEFYFPYNEELFKLINKRYDWNDI